MSKDAMKPVTIEKGIPIPPRKQHSVFEEMEVGDSFVSDLIQKHLAARASAWGKKRGRKFATRKVDDGGVRVWRVE